MKKIITILLIFFIGINIANAESLKCSYNIGAARYVVSYKTGDKELTTTIEADNPQVAAAVSATSDFVLANFRDSNGKLKCLDKVYGQKNPTSYGRDLKYYLTTEYTEISLIFGQKTVLEYSLNESHSSVENDPDKPGEQKDEIIPCTYTDGTYKIVVNYNKTKNSLSYEAPNGYTVSNSILKPDDFKNGCPSNDKYKIVCTTRGGKFCAINDTMGTKTEEPVTEPNADKIKENNEKKEANSGGSGGKNGVDANDPSITGFGDTGDECKKVLGETLSALVKEAIKWVRIFGGIIAIVNATLKLIPAIMAKDAEALNKALKTCVIMAIILVFCILFGWMLNLIGKLFKWDVTCIV